METLAHRIARDGPLNELDAVGWAIRLARRLELLHALGVAHGSISPSCIETAGPERTARGRLTDLRATTPDLGFESPERVAGGDLSAADDTWAVIATLYTLLTASPPFTGVNDEETRVKIGQAMPPPLAVFDVGDDDLQHVIDAGFTREMRARTTRITALRASLEAWHPDPKVRTLPPLDEDEETTTSGDDDDEGGRTVMRSSFDDSAPARMPPPNALPSPMFAGEDATRPHGAPPMLGRAPMATPRSEDDDEEENAKTMLRELPGDIAEKVRTAMKGAPVAPPAPAPAVRVPPPPPSAPRSGHGFGAPAPPPSTPRASPMFAGSAATSSSPEDVASLLARAGAPAARRDAADDDDDLQATVMREAPVFPPGLGGPSPGAAWGPRAPGGGAPPPSGAGQSPPGTGFDRTAHSPSHPLGATPGESAGAPAKLEDHTQPFLQAWQGGQTAPMQQAPPQPPNLPAPSSLRDPNQAWAAPQPWSPQPPPSQSGPMPLAHAPAFPPAGALPQGMMPLSAPDSSQAEPPKGRGMTVLAVLALILTAAVTFALVRYSGWVG